MNNNGISPEWLDELKKKNDIVSVINSYIPLTKKGKNYWACCPFHSEKTPSFAVNEWDQFFHCFSCGESGDVISFVSKYENVDFMTAVQILAEKAKMEIPTYVYDEHLAKEKKHKDRILSLLNETKNFYVENLYKKTSTLPQEYIKKRKITYELLKKFEIGYSEDWTSLIHHLQTKGYSSQEMIDAGVAATKNNHLYDVMAERLMFPIKNSFGDTIAFSGRTLSSDAYAKYKNTTNTLVFDKSKAIFGINLLKESRGNIPYILLVEGQIDVLTMHKNGFTTAVACQGTAFTEKHVKELTRFTDNIIICLDGDSAGKNATIKAGNLFRQMGYNVKAILLPDGLDPDDYFKTHTKEEMQSLIDNAKAFMEYYIERVLEQYNLNNLSQKTEFIKKCLTILKTIPLVSEREIYLKKISELTLVPLASLKRDLENVKQEVKQPTIKQTVEEIAPDSVNLKRIELILACMLEQKSFAKPIKNFENYLNNLSLKLLYEKIVESYKTNTKLTKSQVCNYFDIEKDKVINAIVSLDLGKIENLEKYYNECVWSFYSTNLLQKQELLKQAFNETNDLVKRTEIAKELNEIVKKLAKKTVEE